MRNFVFYIISLCCITLASCTKVNNFDRPSFPALMDSPSHFPAIVFPQDNEFSLEKWELGKKLFFDPVLSRDSSISCASCHQPQLAFSDDLDFSLGVDQLVGTRNSPTLVNVAYHPYFLREGGLSSLEKQILVPIQEHNEFDFNIVKVAERLENIPYYVDAAQQVFERNPDPYVITRSISTFERSLISGQSRYDQHIKGEANSINFMEAKGLELFFSERTNCSSCHGGFNFTNYSFENNGLYSEYVDEGRYRLTQLESDRAKFKVPTLRNIAVTGPYMHDGSLGSMSEVIEHYNTGGQVHKNKSTLLKKLNLTEEEKVQLEAFLHSLTDQNFLENPLFK